MVAPPTQPPLHADREALGALGTRVPRSAFSKLVLKLLEEHRLVRH